MDSTILAAFVSVLVSGVISFSVFLFSQHYLVERSRRRIIRVIFRKISIKTSKGKELGLLEEYRYIRDVKVFEKLIFFLVAWEVSLAIISHYGKSNLITTLEGIELSYAFIFTFLLVGLVFLSSSIMFDSTKKLRNDLIAILSPSVVFFDSICINSFSSLIGVVR